MHYTKIILKPFLIILITQCLVLEGIAQNQEAIQVVPEAQIEAADEAAFEAADEAAEDEVSEAVVQPAEPEVVAEIKTIDFDAVKGVWLTEFKTGAVYFILKRNSIAHYFYKEGQDNTVYKGQWSSDSPERLMIDWENGASLAMDLNSNKTTFRASSRTKEADVIAEAKKIDDDQLGTWARPNTYKEANNGYLPTDYFGLWKISNSEEPSFLFIHKDRYASLYENNTLTSKTAKQSPSLLGQWFKHGQQLHIAWEDGTYSVLDNANPKSVKMIQHELGESILEASKEATVISRDSNLADSWDPKEVSSKDFKAISLGSLNYKQLLKFYRGQWVALSDLNHLERIQLGRFGGVSFQSNKRQKGNWYISGRNILINLENGERMLLRHIGTGFLFFIYEATRPLDGYPNRIVRTAPLDKGKLNNLNTTPTFSLQLVEETSSLEISTSDKDNQGFNESIPGLGGKAPSDNPWWWPIWSDQSSASTEAEANFSKDNTADGLTTERDSIDSKGVFNIKQNLKKSSQTKESNWYWPF
jgi:hypothetical protein